MSRRVCLAIGVSQVALPDDSTLELYELSGAAAAAAKMGLWALHAGFGEENVRVVLDRNPNDPRIFEPVTGARVQAAVDELFREGAPEVDHLLLYFCGHGLTGEQPDSMFWLFGDSVKRRYRVNVASFMARMREFCAGRITLISDACRNIPGHESLARAEARGVIEGGARPLTSQSVDQIVACQDGRQTYMVAHRGVSTMPGKCILSGVIFEILCGEAPEASKIDLMDTRVLASLAREEARARAKDYKLELHPYCVVDPDPLLLIDRRLPAPAPPPQLAPWPPASQTRVASLAVEGDEFLARRIEGVLNRLNTDPKFRAGMLGEGFCKGHPEADPAIGFCGFPDDAGELVAELLASRAKEKAGAAFMRMATDRIEPEKWALAPASGRFAFPGRREMEDVQILQEAKDKGIAKSATPAESPQSLKRRKKTAVPGNHKIWDFEPVISALEGQAILSLRARKLELLKEELENSRPPVEGRGENLIVAGGQVKAVWAKRSVRRIARAEKENEARFWVSTEQPAGTLVLIEFHDGLCAPVHVYPDLYVAAIRIGDGIGALAYGGPEGMFAQSAEMILRLTSGEASIDKLEEIGARLRAQDHANPVATAIAAYVYRSLLDFDNIRRMAYRHALQERAVPYDLAFLGAIPVSSGAAHRRQLQIPAASMGDGLVLRDSLPPHAPRTTPAISGLLAGCVPWLTKGWDYPEVREFEETPLGAKRAAEAAVDLKRPSNFTAFTRRSGLSFAKLWGLRRRFRM